MEILLSVLSLLRISPKERDRHLTPELGRDLLSGLRPRQNLTREGIEYLEGDEKKLAEELLTQSEKHHYKWLTQKVMFLSKPDDDETVKLKQKIINDQKDKSGKNVAFVMGQRYVTLESLKTASKTSELKQ